MKRWIGIAILLFALALPAADNIQIYFSPNGGCTEATTNELGNGFDGSSNFTKAAEGNNAENIDNSGRDIGDEIHNKLAGAFKHSNVTGRTATKKI